MKAKKSEDDGDCIVFGSTDASGELLEGTSANSISESTDLLAKILIQERCQKKSMNSTIMVLEG